MIEDTVKAIREAEEKADALVADAKTESAALIAKAKEEAAKITKEAESAALAEKKSRLAEAEKEGEAFLKGAMEEVDRDIEAMKLIAHEEQLLENARDRLGGEDAADRKSA